MNPRSLSKRLTPALRLAVCAAVASAFLIAAALPCPAASKEELAALADQMPKADPDGKYTGPDPADAQKMYDEVLKGGKENVVNLVGLVVEPGKGEDYKVRYLLHGVVTYVARPDVQEHRQMVCDALASTLGGAAPKAVQGFVIQELQCIADKAAAAAIGKLLLDEELYDPAARALLSIGNTADLFRQALPAAKGRNRLEIIQALGVLRDAQAAADLKKACAAADADVRIAARDALGNIGDASTVDTLLAGAAEARDNERFKGTDAALVLAKRLVEAGNKKDAERVYRQLWDTRTALEERHVRIAGLLGLAEVRGDMADLLAAMKTGDTQIRAAAIQCATATPGREATMKCVDAMEKAAPADRAALLAILGARGDTAASKAVLGAMKDADGDVRAAAMQAAAAIGGEDVAEALTAVASSRPGKDRDVAADALGKMRGKEAGAAVAAAMKQASDPAARATLIGVLAARRQSDQLDVVVAAAADKDGAVRIAAIKALGALGGDAQLPAIVAVLKDSRDGGELEAARQALTTACTRNLGNRCADLVVPALPSAAPANAVAMIRVLGAAGSGKAMDAVAAAAKSTTAEVKDAAVRALADWRGKEAADPLLEVVRTSDNPTHKVLALRGVIRLASAKTLADDDKVRLLSQAMKAAKRPEEKREVLGGLGSVQTLGALEIATACLDEEAVKEEAAAAVVQIAGKLARQNPAAVRDAVEKALKATSNAEVRASAQKILGPAKTAK
jgi:HEAT repeat protein